MKQRREVPRVSVQLEGWLQRDGEKTLGDLLDFFGPKAFAVIFVVLLGVPALPLPTGGVTHVFEAIAALTALQLVVGRDEIWLPARWRRVEVAGPGRERFINGLLRFVRRMERISRPRFSWLFHNRLSNTVFGLLVIAGSAGAFFAPPFTFLDTLPALGVVILSLGVLLEDAVLAAVGIVVGAVGIAVEIFLGSAAVRGLKSLF
jgi:hypothetical protein